MAIVFYFLAALALFSAVMVVSRPSAVHSALWLILAFFAVAGLFILRHAEFLAAVQVLVYAGGIMVLFLFVIMLVNLDRIAGYVRSPARVTGALVLAALMVVAVGVVVSLFEGAGPVPYPQGVIGDVDPGVSLVPGTPVGNLEAVGMTLLTSYLLPFELVSLVLMVAVVGAVVLCKREI